MRFRHRDGTTVHLAYCTNVHPAEDIDGIVAQFDRYAVPIRRRLGVDRLGLGLWLARDVATALVQDETALARLRTELTARGLEVVTLNGFPYRGFQRAVVKHAVYRPDWSERARLEYTIDLAKLLLALLPEDVSTGSVSTLPLGWGAWWSEEHHARALAQLTELTDTLSLLTAREGRSVLVGLEPEPGCVLETTAQAVSALSGTDTEHLGVCLDACHLAVAFEEPGRAVARLREAGLPVVKAQASCALRVDEPRDQRTLEELEAFVEPRFLHQTQQSGDGVRRAVDDLEHALSGELSGDQEWRVHFHTPLHTAPSSPLRGTHEELAATLRALLGEATAHTRHVEVETYTWNVLPRSDGRPEDVGAGIAAELEWTRRQLLELGLTEEGR
ncbi:xylose isomerase [Actinopolyspora erythraea]|uniref:Xylose isomerase n=1 Tax=Actinopolyspora erythraea TaxID=414996 RepID=A0A099D5Z4_9ACTN|nr:metabolite traffic protein EboE [Actinopolyspora erythraea]ASU78784.1 xylose isomerase [Actinopolyspora erythraea]KGI81538.1 xylose isomerase [Actinopolyspora erythraea]